MTRSIPALLLLLLGAGCESAPPPPRTMLPAPYASPAAESLHAWLTAPPVTAADTPDTEAARPGGPRVHYPVAELPSEHADSAEAPVSDVLARDPKSGVELVRLNERTPAIEGREDLPFEPIEHLPAPRDIVPVPYLEVRPEAGQVVVMGARWEGACSGSEYDLRREGRIITVERRTVTTAEVCIAVAFEIPFAYALRPLEGGTYTVKLVGFEKDVVSVDAEVPAQQ